MIGPQVVNASTTYGIDASAENNYGLGRAFRSTTQLRREARNERNAPSWWWLVGALIVLAVL